MEILRRILARRAVASAIAEQAKPERFAQAISLAPRWAGGWYARGCAALAQEDLAAAASDFTEAIRLDPRFGRAFLGRSIALLRAGQAEAALQDVDAAIQRGIDAVAALHTRAMARFAIGGVAESLTDVSLAIRRCGSDGRLWYARARIEASILQWRAAESDFTEAGRLLSGWWAPLYGRGATRVHVGDWAGAEDDLEAARAAGGEYPWLEYYWALCLSKRNDLERARQALEMAIAINSSFLSGLITLLCIDTIGANPVVQARTRERLHECMRRTEGQHELKGDCHFLLRDVEACVAEYEVAAESDEGHGRAILKLALIRTAMAMTDEAVARMILAGPRVWPLGWEDAGVGPRFIESVADVAGDRL